MRALVTGGCGFIGQHLVSMICREHGRGAAIVIDKQTPAATGWDRVYGLIGLALFKGDVADRAFVNKIIGDMLPDVVIHCAAQSHVDASLQDPTGTWISNAVGTAVIAEACAVFGIPLVYCSTDEVYGSTPLDEHGKPIAVDERGALDPSSPYSASKLAGELAVKAMGRSAGLRWAITRGNNAWGEHQLGEKLIPIACSTLASGGAVALHGGGEQLRQWIHVEEFAEALYLVAGDLLDGYAHEKIYNISGPVLCSVRKLVESIARAHKLKPELVMYESENRPGQDTVYYTSGAKLKEDLGFEAKRKVLLYDGLRELVDHYSDAEPILASYTSQKRGRA